MLDDYYLNLLSWGSNNILAVALQKSVYLWHADDSHIDQLVSLTEDADFVTSVQWSPTGTLAIGTNLSTVQVSLINCTYLYYFIKICFILYLCVNYY